MPNRVIVVMYQMLFVTLTVDASVSPTCEAWFENSKIESGTGQKCVWQCVAHPIGMDTFNCASYCDTLCGRVVEERYNIFGVCLNEARLYIKDPDLGEIVRIAAVQATKLTEKEYGSSRPDDESDAFRHFLWAALITKKTGPNKAKAFLEAHESCVTADAAQEMDRANNAQGIEFALAKPRANEAEFVSEALSRIKKRKLIILQPRRTP